MESWKRTFWAAWVAQILAIAGFAFVLPFMPFFIRQLGVSDTASVARWAGIADAAPAFAMGLVAPLWGVLADRYGRKPMVMRAMFGAAAVLALMGLSRNVHQLVAFRFLQGVVTGTVMASIVLVASVTPREQAGFTLGMMQGAVFVGNSIGPLLGGLTADALGYRACFYVAGAAQVVGGLVVLRYVREDFRPEPVAAGTRRQGYAQVMLVPGFLIAVMTLFVLRFANTSSASIFSLLVESLSPSKSGINTVAGSILAIGALAAAIAAGIMGRMSDRWGHRRFLISSCLAAAMFSFAYLAAQTVTQLGVLRVLFSVAAAGLMPAANAIIRNVTADANLGKAYGATTAISSMGLAFGPLSGGYIAGAFGLRAPFALAAVALLVAAAVVYVGVRPSPAVAPEAATEAEPAACGVGCAVDSPRRAG